MFCAQCGTPLQEVDVPEEQDIVYDGQGDQTPGGEPAWQDAPNGAAPWQEQPGGGDMWQGQTAGEGQSWQEQPYTDFASQGQTGNGAPVQRQRKPVPKLLIAVIVEAVAAIGLIIGLVKVTGDRFSPETAALNYWEASMKHEWGKAYDYCNFPDSELLSKQMYVNANANNDDVLNYESVKVHDMAEEAGKNLDDLSSMLGYDASDEVKKLKSDDTKYYMIEYRVKGDEEKSYSYLTVTKTKDKNFLFWDDWKVTSSESWASDVQLTIPENAQLSMNGTKVDDSDAETEGGMKTITIPYMFTGEYQMSVTEEGMEDYNSLIQVSSYGIDESYIELIPSAEVVEELASRAGDDFKTIIESALAGEDFSAVESLFTAEALADGDVQEEYEEMVEELRGDGVDSGIISLQLSDMSIELDSTPNSSYIDFYVTMERMQTYRRSWTDTPGEYDYELTGYCCYEKDGGEWKLSYSPVGRYDF